MAYGPDIRWRQRLQSFESAFVHLSDAADLAATRPLSTLEQQGLIQAFEFTHELAWNVLKDYLEAQGFINIVGSKKRHSRSLQKRSHYRWECMDGYDRRSQSQQSHV